MAVSIVLSSGTIIYPEPYYFWKMQETSGFVATDEQGVIDATYVGNFALNQTGQGGFKSVDFAGSPPGSLQVSGSGSTNILERMDGADGVSIEARIKLQSYTTQGGYGALTGLMINIGSSGVWIAHQGIANEWQVQGLSTGTDSFQGPTTFDLVPNLSTWYHIMVAYDYANDAIRIYRDGTEVLDQAVTFGSSVLDTDYVGTRKPEYFAGAGYSGSRQHSLDASLQEVAVWDEAVDETKAYARFTRFY